MMTMMLMLAICAGYYDDVASEDEDDVDAPGHLGLTIMMMLLVKMRKHCRISVTWPMMKVGAQFHCCSIHIIHTLPLILIRNGINGIYFDLWGVYIKIVISCLTTFSYQLIHSAMLILKKWPSLLFGKFLTDPGLIIVQWLTDSLTHWRRCWNWRVGHCWLGYL